MAIIKPKKENYPAPSYSQRDVPYPVSYLRGGEILYVRMPWVGQGGGGETVSISSLLLGVPE